MSRVSKQVLAAGLLAAGAAWAGTTSVTFSTLSTSGSGSGFSTGGGTLSLTTIESDYASAPTYWQRDRWQSDSDLTRVVQLDIGALNTAVAGTQWIDTCIQSRNLDGATLYDKVESVNASRWWVDTAAADARDTFTALSVPPGSPSTKYQSVTSLRTLRSAAAAATSAVEVPADLGFPIDISFLTGGLRKAASPGDSANYQIVLTFGSGGGAVTRTFTVPILDATRGTTNRNGNSGLDGDSTPTEGGATAVDWHKFNWVVTAPSTTNNLACEANYTNGDEVVLENPGLTDPALSGLPLTKIQFNYTELDPAANGGSVGPHLPGPSALSFTVDSSDYDAAFTYREDGQSSGSLANILKANAGGSAAWWFAVEYDVTWPSDSFSDVYLSMRCGEDNGGAVSFAGFSTVDLTPSGLRALQGSSGAGAIKLDADACYGEYAQVSVEVISAFDTSPSLLNFDLIRDIDDDNDGKTVEGLINPVSKAVGTPTRVVNTGDVHDDQFTWPSTATLIDCDDTTNTIGAAQNYYTDADGDGEGTGAASLLCPAAATGKVTNNTDCRDTGTTPEKFSTLNGNGLRDTETTGAGLDYNCDGSINCFRDADGDGDGSTTVVAKTGITGGGSSTACVNAVVGGTSNDSLDCNDNSNNYSFQANANRATETKSDGNDYNCDGSVSCFVDSDGDHFGTTTEIAVSVTAGGHVDCGASGRATVSTDCEDDVVDGGANIFPGATETTGSGQDRNCSGNVLCYQDNDSDGDGDANGATPTVQITVTAGTSISCVRTAIQNSGATPPSKPTAGNNLDCKDNANTHSATAQGSRLTETTGNGNDYNCDGTVQCFVDNDGDGDGSSSTVAKAVTNGGSSTACINSVPGGTANDSGDCNDNSVSFRPNGAPAESAANGNDFNCDGTVNCFVDSDGDHFGTTVPLPVATTAGGFVDCTASGRATVSTDCEDDLPDSGALFFPGATETTGAGADRDCSGTVLCFLDSDADGDGDENPGTTPSIITVTAGTVISCNRTAGQNASGAVPLNKATSSNATDCNDASNQFSTTVQANRLSETAGNGNDYNCDGTVQCFQDNDADTYGTSAVNVTISTPAVSFVNCADAANHRATRAGDCNDVPGVTPGVRDNGELYAPDRVTDETTGNGNDFGCDGTVTCFQDLDGDGFGTTTSVNVSVPAGGFADCTVSNRSASNTDCNDVAANNGVAFNTSAAEAVGNGVDFNCSQNVQCYGDDDRDGEGESAQVVTVAVPSKGAGSVGFCDRIGAGVANPTSSNALDCNDASASFKSAILDANETVGGTDFNCDGDVRCWPDADHDGRGSNAVGVTPVTLAGAVTPGGTVSCDNAIGGVADDQDDCDDANALTYLNATENIGDQTDFNCDNTIRCYADTDGDTWGSAVVTTITPSTRGGTDVCANHTAATRTGDCNDASTRFNPGNTEEAVGGVQTDYNCDATVNCFVDSDRDGQGTSVGTRSNITGIPAGSTAECLTAQQRSSNNTDCDDADAAVRVGAPETPGSGVDSNCDAVVQCFRDSDGDGYGALSASVPGVFPRGVRIDCSLFGADDGTDCLDCFTTAPDGSCLDSPGERLIAAATNPDPARSEVLESNLIDEDCDGQVACYPDADRDGFGDEATVLSNPATWALSNVAETITNGQGQCLSSQAHAGNGDDCHDDQAAIHPGATHFVNNTTYQEVPSAGAGVTQVTEVVGNAYDDDCDGVVACFYDQDKDGYGIQQPVSANPNDFRIWSGTLQPTPGAAGTFDRVFGGTYTCAAARSEAPLIAGPVFDCNDTNNTVFPGAPEADGQGDDNNCDATVFCFIDADHDSYGGSTDDFAVPGGVKGYISGTNGAELCTTANGFADNGDDCHDNNKFANPSGVFPEVAGHTPEEGSTFNVPGVGLRIIGHNAGAGQYDYCGDGSASCYNAAFDEDCDGIYDCYLDEDGDSWGTDLVHDTRPTNLGATPLLSCDRDASLPENRRAAVGSNSLDDPDRDCHPDVADAHPGRVGGEVPGNAYDDDCDDILACYQDLDNDDYGVLDEVYVTWTGHPTVGVEGFTVGLTPDRGTFNCDTVANGAARRGSANNPQFDCHDNYQLANPGVIAEEPGHTPEDGDLFDVPGVGEVTVGTGGGEFDLCGDGSGTCYGVAFDEDCDGIVQCYVDQDGDGVGASLTNEAGIIEGESRPHTITGTPTDPYTVFTCVTTSAVAVDPNRRSAVGGGVGQADHDCNDGNAGVYPTTELRGAPSEQPGHTTNQSDGTSFAFDEDCDGFVECFEDLDQDLYGTRVVSIDLASGAVRDETAAGTNFKRYNCELLPSGDRTSFARRAGDCHDNNAAAHPGGVEEVGTSVEPFTGGEAAFDEDCNGSFSCYRDRDADSYGTDVFAVSRLNVIAGRTQLPGGSEYDQGVYSCEIAVSDLTWAPGVEQSPLTGRGGEGTGDYDCHDRNGLANPGVGDDPAGNSLDSSGRDDRAYDDDCDGTVECYRNADGDQFGTYRVALPAWDPQHPLVGHVAQDPTGSFFICDSATRRTAGRGGENSVDFDCHDDSPTAYPGTGSNHYAAVVDEDPGDVYDNNCDGQIDCYEDLDNDGYGTRVLHKNPSFFARLVSDQYDPASGKSEAVAGMILYACGQDGLDEAGISLGANALAALGLD
ncbi:MAG TPA: MopE-related protein, partial [Myxococcota bacterium]|nr:MopE-related protein [Myxococcota bacterium]